MHSMQRIDFIHFKKGNSMENDNLDLELDLAMQEIQEKLTGETWRDIRTFLKWEQETVDVFDQMLLEKIQEVNQRLDAELQEMLSLAKPETEAEFWRQLHLYRLDLEAVDEFVGEIRQKTTNARYWVRPYVLGLLTGGGSQIDMLR